MALREEMARTGNWLFKWRSYLPLLIIILILLAIRDSHYAVLDQASDRRWEMLCLLVSLIGLGIRMAAAGYVPGGTSVRETKEQVADELNTNGVYSVVRNPLYLGNFVIWFGMSLLLREWWFSVTIVLIFWLYYERIIFAEEEFLREKFGPAFMQWAAHTPAFIPCLKNWQKPGMPFSFLTVLRREMSSFFAIISSFMIIELIGDYVTYRKVVFDKLWVAIFGSSLVVYLILIVLKRLTRILHVTGR
ncbi:MAG: isoprenylcysteine carboxylmethyltransferase family protein [bacterium]|nr:isoprenylcysteine carboxylmethyltransferase family protein [bacterium]